MAHPSDSSVQVEAEAIIRDKVAALLGTALAPATVTFNTGAPMQVNGAAVDESVLIEIFARQGRLKAGQQKKVALDAFKLITLRRSRPDARLILAFADADAAASARGNGWLAQALAIWGVEVLIVDLDDELRDEIRAAQRLQDMRNVSLPA